jgi:TPR repeat protein
MSARGLLLSSLVVAVLGGMTWSVYRYSTFRSESKLRAGVGALKEGDYRSAFETILPFAMKGNDHAQFMISYMYAYGLGVARDDVRAEIWLRRRECHGRIPGGGEYDLAIEYLKGSAGLRDSERGVQWLRRAAEAGHPDAQRLLARPEELTTLGARAERELVEYWQKFLEDQQAIEPAGGSNMSRAGR